MYSLAVIALAALSAAAPAPGGKPEGSTPQPKLNALQVTATFDDLQPLTQNAALQETGPYDGLNFKGIDTIQLGVAGTVVAGVIPQSYPNAGAYGAATELTQGEPTITSDYPGTTTLFFDFQQFYFGCVAGTVEAVASTPLGCTVTVTGYRESNVVARKSFTYSPNGLVTARMMKAQLGSAFKRIDYATFDSTYDLPDVGATLLDNVKYTTYSLPKKAGKGKSS